jgi:hypothetical protein
VPLQQGNAETAEVPAKQSTSAAMCHAIPKSHTFGMATWLQSDLHLSCERRSVKLQYANVIQAS